MRLNTKRRRFVAVGVLAAVAAGATASIAAATSASGATASIAAATSVSRSSPAGSGTVTVKVTRPSGKTRTRPQRSVTCSVTSGDYVLRFGHAAARRRGGTTLTLAGYHGAGSYTGTLRVLVRGPFLTIDRTLQLPVTLTNSGGRATFTRTLTGKVHPALKGKTISATADWTCTP